MKNNKSQCVQVSNFCAPPDSASQCVDVSVQALDLRVQALALLHKAQALDKLKPFVVTHSHDFGNSIYILWAMETPTQEQAKSVLQSEFEPDRGETVFVGEGFTLEDMAGVSLRARLPEILARID